jgi:hypothetical protein
VSIRSIESLGISEAVRIMVKSEWMRQELKHYYNAPDDTIDIVPPDFAAWINGILATYEKGLKVPIS